MSEALTAHMYSCFINDGSLIQCLPTYSYTLRVVAMLAHDSYKKKVTEWFARASTTPGASHASTRFGP